MNTLGLVYNSPAASSSGRGTLAYSTPETQKFWYDLFNNRSQVIRFAAMTPGYIRAVLRSRLPVQEKFFLLFGYMPAVQQLKGLGNIFDDIGSWFNNTFSQQNMNNIENWIREGSVTAQNIANALNYYSNSPTSQQIANQQQQFQNVQNSVIGTGQGIWQSYGTAITFAALGIAAVLLVKK